MATSALNRRTLLHVCFATLVALALYPHSAHAITELERKLPDLYKYPYRGRGDPLFSFHRPFEPDEDGDPVSGWVTLGSTVVTSDPHGRDIVRLTAQAQANQGLLYAYTRTASNNFNGYFDIQINTSPESHEAADGMAFFFTGSRPVIGSAMGLSHTLQGLGIVIDTFSNSRTRMVPYMYAYVADGRKEWNPDTDGGDTEIAKGCHLENNKPTRIFIKFVDGKLDVGVTFAPHHPDSWHSCFSADNVHLPFADGGYLAFAGETGHFFAAHEVHTASFVAERPNTYHADTSNYDRDRRAREEREHVDRERSERERADREKADRERASRDREYERHDRTKSDQQYHDKQEQERSRQSSEHLNADAATKLASNLDRQVYDVFNSLSEHMRGYNDHDADETRQRLGGIRDMTTHVLKEVNRQREDLAKMVDALSKLKDNASDLQYRTTRFTSHVKSMRESVAALRERTKEIHNTHEEMQEHIESHHEALLVISSKKGHDSGFLILFGVVQVMLVGGALAFSKLTTSSRKIGRMV